VEVLTEFRFSCVLHGGPSVVAEISASTLLPYPPRIGSREKAQPLSYVFLMDGRNGRYNNVNRVIGSGKARFSLRLDLFEIEIGQIHVAVRQNVHGENISPFVETNLE
jgi:hypothetical protein